MKFEKLSKINSYGKGVRDIVYDYYAMKGMKPAEIFNVIESERTYVGDISLLWLKYPNRYTSTIDIDEGELIAEERLKDYKLIWLEPDCFDGSRKVIAEIYMKEK